MGQESGIEIARAGHCPDRETGDRWADLDTPQPLALIVPFSIKGECPLWVVSGH